MGQSTLLITLPKLKEFGEAALRAARWLNSADSAARALLAGAWLPVASHVRGGRWEAPAGFERVQSGASPHRQTAVVFRQPSESWRDGVEAWWCLVERRRPGGRRFTLQIELPGRGDLVLRAEISVSQTPRTQEPATSKSPKLERRRAGAAPVVIDPAWSERGLRDSAMAQLVECWASAGGHLFLPEGGIVTFNQEALDWWTQWAHRNRKGDAAAQLSEAYEVAERTRTPRSPAGHRQFWNKSLKYSGTDPDPLEAAILGPLRSVRGNTRYPAALNEAIQILEIGRSTAYARLQRGGRTLQEFVRERDPLRPLVDFLSSQQRRRIPDQSRGIVNELKRGGMKDNSARRLERRTRNLPPEERARRIAAASTRIRARRSRSRGRRRPAS